MKQISLSLFFFCLWSRWVLHCWTMERERSSRVLGKWQRTLRSSYKSATLVLFLGVPCKAQCGLSLELEMLIFSRFRQLSDRSAQETISRTIMGHMLQCIFLHQWLRSLLSDGFERLAPERRVRGGLQVGRQAFGLCNRSSSSSSRSLCNPLPNIRGPPLLRRLCGRAGLVWAFGTSGRVQHSVERRVTSRMKTLRPRKRPQGGVIQAIKLFHPRKCWRGRWYFRSWTRHVMARGEATAQWHNGTWGGSGRCEVW